MFKTKCSTGDLGAYPGEFVTSYLATAPILVNEIDYITIGETIILADQTTHEGKTMLPFPETEIFFPARCAKSP